MLAQGRLDSKGLFLMPQRIRPVLCLSALYQGVGHLGTRLPGLYGAVSNAAKDQACRVSDCTAVIHTRLDVVSAPSMNALMFFAGNANIESHTA